MSIPVEFVLFGLTLLGVAVFHRHTLMVALIGLAAITAWKGVRSPPEDGAPRPRADAALLALLIVLGQVLLDGLTAKSGFTHYFNATWIACG